MARQLRILYPGAWYHVTCRGNEQASIFWGNQDRKKLLRLLEESAREFSVEVHCYCLMINHFHFILKTLLANLNRFMQRFNTAYTVYFNKKHQRIGHLYQGRYKAILIDADSYLLELSRYIHLNPIRTKEMSKATFEEKLAFLENFEWSSYRDYIGKADTKFLKRDLILSMIGGKGKEQFRNYRKFVIEGIKERIRNPLDERKANSILGNEKFIEDVYNKYVQGKEEDREYGYLEEIIPSLTIEDIAKAVAQEFKIAPEDLLGRYSRTSGAGDILAELCCKHVRRHTTLDAIAAQFGISVGGLLLKRKRLRRRVAEDKRLGKRIAGIENNLLTNKKV